MRTDGEIGADQPCRRETGAAPARSMIATVESRRRPGRFLEALGAASLAIALAAPVVAAAADAPRRPNIVIILGDDLGFADMGSFGGEIRTPNLDALAREGVRYTNFYTHASCSPTRSMLLTGVDTHRNGLGNMDEWTAPNQRGRGRLRGLPQRPGGDPAAAAQGCRLSHLHGRQVAPRQGARPDPAARGFERDFSLLDGAGSYWDMTNSPAPRRCRSSPRTVVISPSCPTTTTRPRPTPTS